MPQFKKRSLQIIVHIWRNWLFWVSFFCNKAHKIKISSTTYKWVFNSFNLLRDNEIWTPFLKIQNHVTNTHAIYQQTLASIVQNLNICMRLFENKLKKIKNPEQLTFLIFLFLYWLLSWEIIGMQLHLSWSLAIWGI